MTKREQIEEMAKIIDNRLIEARGYLGSMNRGEGYWIAQKLIEHYQPKLPENSIVLSEEEWECLHNDYAKTLYNARQQTRKETEKEILNTVDNESNGQTMPVMNYLRKKIRLGGGIMAYERLTIKRHDKNYIKTPVDGVHDFLVITNRVGKYEYTTGEVIDRLAELEDMIEDGTLVELPCKVGDTVYYIRNGLIYFSTISKIEILGNSIMFSMDDHYYGYTVSFDGTEFGKRIFFTVEEAEAKLKELKK